MLHCCLEVYLRVTTSEYQQGLAEEAYRRHCCRWCRHCCCRHRHRCHRCRHHRRCCHQLFSLWSPISLRAFIVIKVNLECSLERITIQPILSSVCQRITNPPKSISKFVANVTTIVCKFIAIVWLYQKYYSRPVKLQNAS